MTCSDGYSGTLCDSCATGYLQTSANGEPFTCGACIIAHCDVCTGNINLCVTCAIGWLYPNCDTCAIGFTGVACDGCNTGYTGLPLCNGCATSHYDADPDASILTCTACNSAMLHCVACTTSTLCGTCDAGYTGNTCASCSPGYYDSTTGGGAFTCSACPTNCQTCTALGCTACFDGYIDSNTGDSVIICDGCAATGYFVVPASSPIQCTACLAHCNTCSDSSTCTTCSIEYTGSTCNVCATGYYRTAGGICSQCSIDVNTHCTQCTDTSTCTVC